MIVQVSTHLIHQVLSQGTGASKVASNPLPDDAVLVAVNSDGRTVSLTFQSDSFEEIPDGDPIPLLSPTFRSIEATEKGAQ